jgi:hypothetical protein
MSFSCPVCGFDGLDEQPWTGDLPSDDICPSCGTQFGYQDMRGTLAERELRWAELRQAWLDRGRPWTSRVEPRPENWPPMGTSAPD